MLRSLPSAYARALRQRFHPLLFASLATALLVAAPIAGVLSNLLPFFNAPDSSTADSFNHLWSTVLPEYIGNTVILAGMVAILAGSIGVGCAWLVAAFEFPGKRWCEWALVLPLAMPAYVVAYAYTDFLQFSGPVQTALRAIFGWQAREYWFPEIRSLSGAGIVFSFVLYPYVYLLARNAFLERSPRMWDAARTLGSGPWVSFFRIVLPLARPAAVAGLALALMETLADYGAVSYFGVPTLTTGIYKSWYAFSDRVAAAQIAGVLLLTVAILMALEQKSRGRARYYAMGARASGQPAHRLGKWQAAAAVLLCSVPIAVGFVLPTFILLKLMLQEPLMDIGARQLGWLQNSVLLGFITAMLAMVLCVLLAYAARISRSPLQGASNRVVSMGYAIPGSVIAVGILIPLSRIDNWAADRGMDLLLTGSVAALVYAYLVRFLAVSYQSVQAGLAKITPAMDASARSLGLGIGGMLVRVHAPLLWRSVLTAGLLVFVDVIKELPATLAVRPFNYDTLAVITHQLAADERLGEAALPALTIVAIALVPVVALARAISQQRR